MNDVNAETVFTMFQSHLKYKVYLRKLSIMNYERSGFSKGFGFKGSDGKVIFYKEDFTE